MARPPISHQSNSLPAADNIRLLSAAMVEKANSGHPGGPMGGADFIEVLYAEYLQFDPENMNWPLRDRFYLDAGHMSAMLYAQLTLLGAYSMEDIQNFRQWQSPTPGHPEVDFTRGIENTSGPLGLGHTFGVGSAIAERFLQERFGDVVSHKTYLYISDGGVQEEISQGAGRIAGYLGLGQIIMFYDANDIQLSTEVDAVTAENTAQKYEAWGWHVITIEGNNHNEIRKALDASIAETSRPSLIIGKTIMGKGVKTADGEMYEGKVELHGKPLGKSNGSFAKTVEGLGGSAEQPFTIFDSVATYYQEVIAFKKQQANDRQAAFDQWCEKNPGQAKKWSDFQARNLPELNWDSLNQKANVATRNASGAVLDWLADRVDNMIVASADLCNSDKTEAFLKKTGAFTHHNFSGAFLQAGVSELTMAALATGMALHGGVIPVCATFFAFSDYMKPAIRVCALMEQPVIYLWTHDAFRVGEDGPTHQPIEQEAQIRLLEKVKNHHGQNSFLALRPADAAETTVCWKMALENAHSPTGLILSRQNINSLNGNDKQTREQLAHGATKGAYIAYGEDKSPDIVLIANGSEVSTLEGTVALLEQDGISARIISVPSEGLFRSQSEAYQDEILPSNIPRYGLTAGLSHNLSGLVGSAGEIWGLNHFGYSAPYTVLDQKFGFYPEHIAKEVKRMLKK